MLEAAIPALWSTVHGWFTPAVLFLVLNLVIGTIAVTSKVTAAASATGDAEGVGDGDGAGGQNRKLSRVPSMALDRLRSFNLSRLAAPAPEAPVTGVLDLGSDEHLPRLENEEEEEDRGEIVEHEHEDEHAHAHAHAQARVQMERSRSEAAAEAERPPLPARMRRSATEMSAFARFAAEEDIETVEARRPATTRDVAAARREELVAEEETEEAAAAAAAGEVDARADDFINKFRHQLKLQRIDSFMRNRDMLRRGQAAAAAAAVGTE